MGKSREMAPSLFRSGRAAIDHRRPCASFDLTKEEDVKPRSEATQRASLRRCVSIILIYNLCGVQIIYGKEINLTHRFAELFRAMNGLEKNGRKFLFKVVFVYIF